MQGYILQKGSMARAARASASFPFLFQSISWLDDDIQQHFVLIDGGIADHNGLHRLSVTIQKNIGEDGSKQNETAARAKMMSIGDFCSSPPPGPSTLPGQTPVIFLSIKN
jgi:hypothetical protein